MIKVLAIALTHKIVFLAYDTQMETFEVMKVEVDTNSDLID